MSQRHCLLLSFLLDQKGPKSQGQNHRPAAQSPNRLTFRSGSDFCEVKRQAPLRENQAVSRPLGNRCPAFWPCLPAQPSLVLAFPHSVGLAAMSSLRGPVWWHGIYGCGSLHHSLFQCYTRQQTTTNDYSRLQTFNQRLFLDKGCIFAA